MHTIVGQIREFDLNNVGSNKNDPSKGVNGLENYNNALDKR